MRMYELGGVSVAVAPIIKGGANRRASERAAVNALLKSVFGDDVRLGHHESGAPFVNRDVNVSISHSMSLAVVAWSSDKKIGVDAESWRPTLRRVAMRFLSEAEAERFTDDDSLLKAWTIKEAVYKIVGEPVADLHNISILPDMRQACALGDVYQLYSMWVDDNIVTVASPSPPAPAP